MHFRSFFARPEVECNFFNPLLVVSSLSGSSKVTFAFEIPEPDYFLHTLTDLNHGYHSVFCQCILINWNYLSRINAYMVQLTNPNRLLTVTFYIDDITV